MSDYAAIAKEAAVFTEECVTNNRIDPSLFDQYNIKRGLRDQDGKGVLAGITNISRIDAFEEKDGKKVPCDGKLWFRGYEINDLVNGIGDRGFEEVAYLLLMGELPDREELDAFCKELNELRRLPPGQMPRPAHQLCAGRHHESPQPRPDELADPQCAHPRQLR
mgnify:CR=1 FL=1